MVKQRLHVSCHKTNDGDKGTIKVASMFVLMNAFYSCFPAYNCFMFICICLWALWASVKYLSISSFRSNVFFISFYRSRYLSPQP